MIYFMLHILLLVPTILIIRRIIAELRAVDTAETPVSLPIIYHPAPREPLSYANQNKMPKIPKIIYTNKLKDPNLSLLSAR